MPQPPNITPPKLDPDGAFRVREFTFLILAAAIVFYGLFFLALVNVLDDTHKNTLQHERRIMYILLLCLLPAIRFTYRAIRQKEYIRVDATGIYLYKTLLTAWPNFIDAMFADERRAGNIAEHNVLYIYYYKDGKETHQTRFQLGGTQNRAEEEVIAAIRWFYVQSGYGVAC